MSDDSDLEQLLKNFQKALDSLNKIGDVESLVTKVDAKKNRKLLKKLRTVVSDVHNKVSTLKEKFSSVYNKTKIGDNYETDGSSLNKSISGKKTEFLGSRRHVDHDDSSSPVIGEKTTHLKKPPPQSKDQENETDQEITSCNETTVEGNEQETDPTECNGQLEEHGKQNLGITAKQKESCHKMSDKNEVNDENMEKNDKAGSTNEKNNDDSESSEEILESTPSKPSTLRSTLSLRKKQDETNQYISEMEIVDSPSKTDKDEAYQEKSENNKNVDGQSKSFKKKKGNNMEDDNSGKQSERKHDNQQNVITKGPDRKNNSEEDKDKEDSNSEVENEGSDEVVQGKKNNKVQKNQKSGEENEDSDIVEISDVDESILTDTTEKNRSDTAKQTENEDDNEGSDHTDTEGRTKTVYSKKNKRSEVERGNPNKDNVKQRWKKRGSKKGGSSGEESDDSDTNAKKGKQKHNKEINENMKSVISEEGNNDFDGKENIRVEKNKSKEKGKNGHRDKDENKGLKDMNCEAGNVSETDQKEESGTVKTQKGKSKESKHPDGETEGSVSKDEAEQNRKCTEKESENVGDKQEIKEDNTSEKPLVPRIKLVDINKLLAPNKKPMDMTPTPADNKNLMSIDEPVIILTSSEDDIPIKERKARRTAAKMAVRKTRKVSKVDSDSDKNIKISDESEFGGPTRSRRLRNREKPVSAFAELIKKRRDRRLSYGRQIYTDDSSEEESSKSLRRSKRTKRGSSTSGSDEEWGEKSRTKNNNMKKRKRKKLLEKISLSDDSDSSLKEVLELPLKSSGTNKVRSNHTKPDKSDPKFSMGVSIRLPKFKCEELVELYKKKMSKIGILHSVQSKKQDSSKNSDDSNTPKCKKRKVSLELNRTEKAKEIDSEVEQLNTENVIDEDKNMGKKADGETDEDIVILDENVETSTSTIEEIEQAEEPSDEGKKNSGDEQAKKDSNDDDETSEGKKKEVINVNEEDPKKSEERENVGKDKEDGGSSEGDEEPLGAKKNVTHDITDNDDDKEKDTSRKHKTKRKTKKNDSSDEQKEKEPTIEDNKVMTSSDSDDNNEQQKRKDKKDISSGEDNTPKKKKEKTGATDTSSDSDDDFTNFSRNKTKSKKKLVSEVKKRPKNKLISDSDSDDGDKSEANDSDSNHSKDKNASQSDNNSEEETERSEGESEKSKNSARKRIKRVKDSSSDEEDKSTRKQIRKVLDRDSLSETTKKAEQEEKERKARIAEKQKKIFELKADATVDKVVLDFDEKTDKPLLSVHKKLVKHLKPHQVHGVKFMWDTCFESLERARNTPGSGCILAHCMGLGKTLQVIALIHTLLTNQAKTKVEKVLVVCPVSTVLNWKNEFEKWMPKSNEFEIFELVSCKTTSINHERSYVVQSWHEDGGVLIIGYNMFRTLSNPQNKSLPKKLRESFQKGLVDPGPDLVVCDEGHLLKNEKSNLSIAMNRIKTARRIVLTGTPLQNNLREYWCMVQFIKPNLLGTYKEYLNRFVNPITNGQYTDSTQRDIMVMRRRSHVLHKLLDGVVQRQDYSVLEPYLPPKYEYVVFVRLTEIQVKLYKHYMKHLTRRGDNSNKTSALFNDFQELQRICTHPRVLLQKSIKDRQKEELMDDSESEGSLKDFIDDDTSTSASSSSSSGSEDGFISDDSAEMRSSKAKKKTKTVASRKTRMTRALAADNRKNGILSDNEKEEEQPKEWWEDYISKDELDNINHGSKLFLLFQILKECEDIGDKILIFSQSLYTLNCIEYFLEKIDHATQKGEIKQVGGHSGSWALGLDYFRLDGSSSCDDRASWCDHFNDPDNTRARLFLISTRAGGLGINLVAANRVIIFDVSWNPSHDIQSIYRVYRFGQTKPAYIYRFVTYGTMEMKIYERQVTKQAISKRVIDEQQIDRHYSQHDIMELYNTDLEPTDRPIPMVPKDVLLGEMLQKYENTIFKYHEHQSLLENKQDEELNEEERKAAWEEFENEKVMRKTTIANFGGLSNVLNFSPQLIQMALANIVRKDNPAWSEIQVRGILPALVSQLQVQMTENDFSMYSRVQQEIKLMQALHTQRMREIQMKQYQAQLQQKLTHDMLGNMSITPEEIRRIQMAQASQNFIQAPTTSAIAPGEVIELND